MQNQSHQLFGKPENLEILYDPPVFESGCPFYPARPTPQAAEGRIQFLHYHNGVEFGWCFEGAGVFFVEDRVVPYQAPCASVIYRGQAHIAQSAAQGRSQWYFLSVDDSAFSYGWPAHWLRGHADAPILPAQGDATGVPVLIHTLVEELQRQGTDYLRCAATLTEAILCRHARLAGPGFIPAARWRLQEIAPAITHIANSYTDPVSVPTLAALCGMSEAALRRKFREAVGRSPLDYLHRVRISAAISLLGQENLTILEISARVGYDSQSSFNRQFQRVMGLGPRDYRKRLVGPKLQLS